MTDKPNTDLTKLLSLSTRGNSEALNAVFPIVYDELRALAMSCMGSHVRWGVGGGGQTLQATALVNEAYVKLMGTSAVSVKDRSHFFALAARAMRQILVNHARDNQRLKRGGGWKRITLSDVAAPGTASEVDVQALDDALNELGVLSERKARLVELRFFSGLSIEEAAQSLGVGRSTLAEDWAFTRAWLSQRLTERHTP